MLICPNGRRMLLPFEGIQVSAVSLRGGVGCWFAQTYMGVECFFFLSRRWGRARN